MEMRAFRLITISVVFVFYLLPLVYSNLTFVQNIFNMFQKIDRIRVNYPLNAETLGDHIMRRVQTQQCEDALCPNCVPGFCRLRPRPSTPLDFQNMTNGGYSNITGTIPNFTNANLTGSIIPNNTAVNGILGLGPNLGANGLLGNIANGGLLSNLPNGGSLGNIANGGLLANLLNGGLFGNLTNGGNFTNTTTPSPPVKTTTLPPMICACSWI